MTYLLGVFSGMHYRVSPLRKPYLDSLTCMPYKKLLIAQLHAGAKKEDN